MSVNQRLRGESKVQFLETARELHLEIIKLATTIPKKYTFYISQILVKSAATIHAHAKRGNSIFATNSHERQLRRECFIMAYAECQNLSSQLDVAYELSAFTSEELPTDSEKERKNKQEKQKKLTKRIIRIMELVDTELKLLKGVLDKSK